MNPLLMEGSFASRKPSAPPRAGSPSGGRPRGGSASAAQ